MCEIGGRVTDKETGQPIARAIVGISMNGGKTRLATRTDDEGVYRFTDLSARPVHGTRRTGEFRATHISTSIGPASNTPPEVRRCPQQTSTLCFNAGAPSPCVFDDAEKRPPACMSVSEPSLDEFNPHVASDRHQGHLRRFRLQLDATLPAANRARIRSAPLTVSSGVSVSFEPAIPPLPPRQMQNPSASISRTSKISKMRMRRGRTFTISGTVLTARLRGIERHDLFEHVRA